LFTQTKVCYYEVGGQVCYYEVGALALFTVLAKFISRLKTKNHLFLSESSARTVPSDF